MFADLKRDFLTLYGFEHLCSVCGAILETTNLSGVICDELATDWRLTGDQRRYFDFREGCSCKKCGSSVRVMNFGKTMLEGINNANKTNFQSVSDISFSRDLGQIRIGEINNCGPLHTYLRKCSGLAFSEYGSVDPAIPSEDLMALSYHDGSFDLVLASDVIEHVPNYRQALLEVHRVLKDDGVFIFTVPYLTDRKTLVRAEIKDGEVCYLKSKSFHGVYSEKLADYLVFYEFGVDFVEDLQGIFDVGIYCCDGYGGHVSSVFSCKKRSW